mmetsp:Transcript_70209/g.199060  ORF Transcript_70209/g.199060 Transcript_70209/m.199060 type:complete len:297 (-) Transcript_70209:1290-2180(-)
MGSRGRVGGARLEWAPARLAGVSSPTVLSLRAGTLVARREDGESHVPELQARGVLLEAVLLVVHGEGAREVRGPRGHQHAHSRLLHPLAVGHRISQGVLGHDQGHLVACGHQPFERRSPGAAGGVPPTQAWCETDPKSWSRQAFPAQPVGWAARVRVHGQAAARLAAIAAETLRQVMLLVGQLPCMRRQADEAERQRAELAATSVQPLLELFHVGQRVACLLRGQDVHVQVALGGAETLDWPPRLVEALKDGQRVGERVYDAALHSWLELIEADIVDNHARNGHVGLETTLQDGAG